MKKEKRSIGFSDSAMFNYELDTNEELKKGLASLSEQIPISPKRNIVRECWRCFANPVWS